MEFVKNYIDFSNVLKAKDVRHGTHAHGDGPLPDIISLRPTK